MNRSEMDASKTLEFLCVSLKLDLREAAVAQKAWKYRPAASQIKSCHLKIEVALEIVVEQRG